MVAIRATEKSWANYRSQCRARPFEVRNQLSFSAHFSEDPESPGVDIEEKRESFVAVLGEEDRPGLRKKFALPLTIPDDREMVSLRLDGEHVVLRAVPPGQHCEERRRNLNDCVIRERLARRKLVIRGKDLPVDRIPGVTQQSLEERTIYAFPVAAVRQDHHAGGLVLVTYDVGSPALIVAFLEESPPMGRMVETHAEPIGQLDALVLVCSVG